MLLFPYDDFQVRDFSVSANRIMQFIFTITIYLLLYCLFNLGFLKDEKMLLFKREKLWHYIFQAFFHELIFLMALFLHIYADVNLYVIYVCVCMNTNMHVYNIDVVCMCVCEILNTSTILWAALMDTSASCVLWDLFEDGFRFFS